MPGPRTDLREWGAWMSPECPGAAEARLRTRIEDGDLRGAALIDARSPDGSLAGGWALLPQGGREVGVACLFGGIGSGVGLLRAIEQAAHASSWVVTFRLAPQEASLLGSALRHRAWSHRGVRVEWSHPCAQLPEDAGTPLRWRRADRVSEASVAALLEAVTRGDPLRPLHGDAAEWLRGWEETPGLWGHFWVGHIDDVPVALLGAQVERSTGWCRLPYWGVTPSSRGCGYGRFVLYKGFSLLRAMGGRRLAGGCAASNTSVLRLIKGAGIRPDKTLEEWNWPPD